MPLPQAVKAEANVAVIVKNRVFQVLYFCDHAILTSQFFFRQVSVNGSPVIKRELSKEVMLHKNTLMKFNFAMKRCKES